MDTATLPDLLRYGDLDRYGLSRHRFDRLIDEGEYERIAAGLFLRTGSTDDTTSAWMAIASPSIATSSSSKEACCSQLSLFVDRPKHRSPGNRHRE